MQFSVKKINFFKQFFNLKSYLVQRPVHFFTVNTNQGNYYPRDQRNRTDLYLIFFKQNVTMVYVINVTT